MVTWELSDPEPTSICIVTSVSAPANESSREWERKKSERKKETNERKERKRSGRDIIKFARPGNWTGARYRRCVASFPRRSCSARAKITSQQLSCSSRNCRRLVSRTGLAQHCSYWVLCFVFVFFSRSVMILAPSLKDGRRLLTASNRSRGRPRPTGSIGPKKKSKRNERIKEGSKEEVNPRKFCLLCFALPAAFQFFFFWSACCCDSRRYYRFLWFSRPSRSISIHRSAIIASRPDE